jgi:hypothetical protein
MKSLLLATTFVLILRHALAAEECYVCLEKCDDPLQRHACRDDGLSEDDEIKCYSIEVVSGDLTSVEKGCLPADVADAECAKANEISGTRCTVCDTDLCNGHSVGTGGGEMAVLSYFLVAILGLVNLFV